MEEFICQSQKILHCRFLNIIGFTSRKKRYMEASTFNSIFKKYESSAACSLANTEHERSGHYTETTKKLQTNRKNLSLKLHRQPQKPQRQPLILPLHPMAVSIK